MARDENQDRNRFENRDMGNRGDSGNFNMNRDEQRGGRSSQGGFERQGSPNRMGGQENQPGMDMGRDRNRGVYRPDDTNRVYNRDIGQDFNRDPNRDYGSDFERGQNRWPSSQDMDFGMRNQSQFGSGGGRSSGWRDYYDVSSDENWSGDYGLDRGGMTQSRGSQRMGAQGMSGMDIGSSRLSGRSSQMGASRSFGMGGRSQQGESGQFRGRGPKGYQRSDDRIREEVCEVLTDHGDIDASEMEVNVSGGIVTLTGSVENGRMRRMAEEVVEELPGVQDVRNEIRVKRRQPGVSGMGLESGEKKDESQRKPSSGLAAAS